MGITVSYRGSLEDVSSLPHLVDQVRHVCAAFEWPCKDVETLVAEGMHTCRGLRGVSLRTHPRCEWLHLHVDPDGRLVNHFYWAMTSDTGYRANIFEMLRDNQRQLEELGISGGDGSGAGKGRAQIINLAPEHIDIDKGAAYNWVKTQFGGVEAHVAVCAMLRWLKRGYAPELVVRDDSGYYDHGDITRLERDFAALDAMVDGLRRGLSQPAEPDAIRNSADLVAHIEKILNDVPGHLH